MKKLPIFGIALALAIILTLAACGTDAVEELEVESLDSDLPGEDFSMSFPDASTPTPAPLAADAAPEPLSVSKSEEGFQSTTSLQVAERQIISSASLSMQVEQVQSAVNDVRAIAEGLGGFVGQLSFSGSEEYQQATMTIRVPQGQFFSALDRIKTLGKVHNENLGSEDVTEQFIDLEARLNSAKREEESLLALLTRVETVSEILTVERELSRIRSEIESLQGRLNFLERRVELATIAVSLFPPGVEIGEPPVASLIVEASDVSEKVEDIKALVFSLNGKVDRVAISVRNGNERAEIVFRVFTPEFEKALTYIEALGEVLSKDLQEGSTPVDGEINLSDEPNAHISAILIEEEEEDSFSASLIAVIVAPIAVVMLAILLILVYRAGRRRGSV